MRYLCGAAIQNTFYSEKWRTENGKSVSNDSRGYWEREQIIIFRLKTDDLGIANHVFRIFEMKFFFVGCPLSYPLNQKARVAQSIEG